MEWTIGTNQLPTKQQQYQLYNLCAAISCMHIEDYNNEDDLQNYLLN